MSDFKVLSIQRIREFFEDDDELIRSSLQLFVDKIDGYLHELLSNFEKGDQVSLKRNAHTLKGVFANFQIELMIKLARELELAIEDESEELVRKLIEEVRINTQIAKQEAQKIVDSLS